MKKLFLLGLAVLLFAACQQQEKKRYFSESAEIDVLKAGIAAYESGDWDKWKSHFADTAKVYVNSKESVTVDDRLKELSGSAAALSTYGFDKENDWIEMVIDADDETWEEYAKKIEDTGVAGIELNFYAIPRQFEIDGRSIITEQIDLLEKVKKAIKIPVAAKLSPYYTNPLHVIAEMDKKGVDALVATIETGITTEATTLCLECPVEADVETVLPSSLVIERDLKGGASRVVILRRT